MANQEQPQNPAHSQNPVQPQMAAQAPLDNPYVGPRTFTQAESTIFFGREREARELLSVIISQRLVLFYAQSGAGKSSLINTRVIPQLRDQGFLVLPVGRVGGDLPTGVDTVDNVYAFNLMLGLDQGDGNPKRFARLNLTHFLNQLTTEEDGETWFYEEEAHSSDVEIPISTSFTGEVIAQDGATPSANEGEESEDEEGEDGVVTTPFVLIIDQFEEIITNHPDHWPERAIFFEQLEAAMQADPALWVVLVLREDFVAALDPYAHIMSDKLRARFYMERMGVQAAHQAIRRPAELGGRPFAPGVAELLADHLRQVHGISPDQPEDVSLEKPDVSAGTARPSHSVSDENAPILGQYLEPVQLQVVCYQLWENIRHTPPAPITFQNLAEAGNVDRALAAFYEDAIHTVLAHPRVRVTERELRAWFGEQLITEADTRGTVYQGTAETEGMPNQVVTLLSEQFLLRTELRAGGAWIELVHDRFVEPILKSNRVWLERQSPLMRASQRWMAADRDSALLMSPQQLEAMVEESDSEQNDRLITRFIAASRAEARRQAIKERAAQREKELENAHALANETEARLKAEAERAAEAEARQREQAETAAKLRKLAIFLGILGVLSVILAGLAAFQTNTARKEQVIAVTERANAEEQSGTAVAALAIAKAEKATATAALAIAEKEKENAELQSTAAAQALNAAQSEKATAVAAQQQEGDSRAEALSAATAVAFGATAAADELSIANATIEALGNDLAMAFDLVNKVSELPVATPAVTPTPVGGSEQDDGTPLTPTRTPTYSAAATEEPTASSDGPSVSESVAAEVADLEKSLVQFEDDKLAAQKAEQEAISEPLWALAPDAPLNLLSKPDIESTILDNLRWPDRVQVVQFDSTEWALVESDSGQQGWIRARLYTYEGNTALLPPELRVRAVSKRDDLPYIYGEVAQYSWLSSEPGNADAGYLLLPCGTEVTLLSLIEDVGTQEWLLVTLVDPKSPGEIRTGSLPKSAVQPFSPTAASVCLTADPATIAPGDCAALIWEANEISAVYYQGSGKTGFGLSRECPDKTTEYTLRVLLQDGSELTQKATVTVDPSAIKQRELPPSWYIASTEPSVQSGECTYIIWRTRNVSKVYYKGEGVSGNAVRYECLSVETNYKIEVVTQAGETYNEFVTVQALSQ